MYNALCDFINYRFGNLGGFTPVIDNTGKITGYKTTSGGADTVFPFSNYEEGSGYLAYGSNGITITFKNKYTNNPLVAISQVDSNGHSVEGIDGYRFYLSSITNTFAKLEITSVLGTVGAYYRYIVISND